MRIGYACLTVGVDEAGIRSCTLGRATTANIEEVARHNLRSLRKILEWNAANGIRMFRISSDIIPLASHPAIAFPWQQVFKSELAEIGAFAKSSDIRLSMHPGQYTVLNSPDDNVVRAATADLRFHADFLDLLGVDVTSKIILHVGGVYGNRDAAMARFIENFNPLNDNVRQRLVIENDDNRFPVEDVLKISRATDLPVVFDNLHHLLNPSASLAGKTDAEIIAECAKTWGRKDGRPKIHYSQQREGGRQGAHSATIDLSRFLPFIASLPENPPDIMLEVKDKNLSARKCILALRPSLKAKDLEAEWARYKYAVLERDPAAYAAIRSLLKDKGAISKNPMATAQQFYAQIDAAIARLENTGTAVNALEHVWGYFKDTASAAERKRWIKLLTGYQSGTSSLQAAKKHLARLARNHEQRYLTDSLYFDL